MFDHPTRQGSLLLAGAAALSLAASAQAATIQPDEATSEDTLIYEFLSTTPLHASFGDHLPALSTESGHDADSLVRFDVSSLGATDYLSATLNLYVGDITSSGFGANPDASHPVNVQVHANQGAFVEATATWGNAPAFGGVLDSLSIDAIDQWVSFDVTDIVGDWLDGTATNFGFRLTGDGTRVDNGGSVVGVVFNASATGNQPYLALNYIPEPGVGLLAVTGLALLSLRRRAGG